jgi:hypothetical protein
MSLFDPHNADPDWQRLFGEAADTPPPRVWEAIERELDDETDAFVPVIPFWRRSVFQRVAAAAVLILLAGGIFVVQSVEKKAVVAENSHKTHKENELSTNCVDNYQKSGQNVDNVGLQQPKPKELPSVAVGRGNEQSRQQVIAEHINSISKVVVPTRAAHKVNINQDIIPKFGQQTTDKRVAEMAVVSALPFAKLPEIILKKSLTITPPTPALHQPLQVDLLPSPVWASHIQVATHEPAIEPQQPTASAKSRNRWLSVSVGQAAFQPSVALRFQPMPSASNTIKGSVSVPDQLLASRAGAAISVLAVAGFHLSSRWFVEGGAGYQQAQSVVVSPGQTISAFTAATISSSTLYADALLGSPPVSQNSSVQTNRPGSALFDSRNRVNQASEQRSTYQFGQATAQLGYQFRSRKRLGIAALGGFIANLFVKNEVENGPVIRATNAVYRPVSVAGLGGFRLRYRASGRWSVSMAGLYQYSLSSITQPGALLSVQPQNVSINGSLDYHF